jgi:antitoxin (DNA-binding transcriptional repressor) of toxin-antitoxin stability system
MSTRFIGVKELRQNMAKIVSQAQRKKERLIILRKNIPIFELKPLSKTDVYKESFISDIKKARENTKKSVLYSQNEIEKMLGL